MDLVPEKSSSEKELKQPSSSGEKIGKMMAEERDVVERLMDLPPNFQEQLENLLKKRDAMKIQAERISPEAVQDMMDTFNQMTLGDLRNLAGGGYDVEGLTDEGQPYENWKPQHFQALLDALGGGI